MRTFESVDIDFMRGRPHRSGALFVHIGILPVDVNGEETPHIIFEITFERYRAEQAAIRAKEAIRAYVEDDWYFALIAAERAQALAHGLLSEILE